MAQGGIKRFLQEVNLLKLLGVISNVEKFLRWFNWRMNKNTQLVSLSYISNTAVEISLLGNLRLLAHSFLNNQKYNITGLLIYKNKQFAQVIEGDEDAIERIWSKIQRDTRHTDIQLLSKEPIIHRSFTKWSMLFPESEKAVEYFPEMVEAVRDLEIPANHPLFKILAN
jgi:hypothetical protein